MDEQKKVSRKRAEPYFPDKRDKIAALKAEGKTNREIGDIVGMSRGGVNYYYQNWIKPNPQFGIAA